MKKITLLLFAMLTIFIAQTAFAQSNQNQTAKPNTPDKVDLFKAKIIDIQNIREGVGLDGIKTYIQNIKLRGLEKQWKNKEITIQESEFNSIGPDAYKKGDIMIISHNKDENGQDAFGIFDYSRENSIYLLGFLFIGLVILIGRTKGIKALIALILSFLVIIYFILPQIVAGGDPVIISAIGAIFIAFSSLYITYGFKHFSHIAAASLGSSLILTVIISQIFTVLARLTGNTEENITYLSQILGPNFNARGLLLAGFIIGALGVLNDVVINQISLVEELYKMNHSLHWKKLFQKGLKVGIDHISAIVNTLFLAYVGTSLPLLLLFVTDKTIRYDTSTVINMEMITTEIVRTLAGSLGLILSVPIATLIGAVFIPKYAKKYKKELFEHI